MFREMACFVISWKAIKPEQHINIDVCGSGLVVLWCSVMNELWVAHPQQSKDESVCMERSLSL